METQTAATIEDLYAVEGKAELIGGRIVVSDGVGEEHGRITQNIELSLVRYEDEYEYGYTLPVPVAFIVDIPGRQSFSPDVAFVEELGEQVENFHIGPPLFAVEVRSKNDHGPQADRAYADKRRDYFAAGTLVVWDVNPRTRTIASYRRDAPDNPTIFQSGETADAEPAVPHWRVAVDRLFRIRRTRS